MDVHHRVRDMFEAAVAQPKERRSAFLRSQCGNERTIYDEVARLVAAYESGIETGGDSATGLPEDAIGRSIGFGAYEIVRELGRGGMGTVYLARRVDGTFDREVAVKVVGPENAAATAFERFARERRLLAKVDHPGIATLFDAGSTEDGMPGLRHGVCGWSSGHGALRSSASRRPHANHPVPANLRRGRLRAPRADRALRSEACEHPGERRRESARPRFRDRDSPDAGEAKRQSLAWIRLRARATPARNSSEVTRCRRLQISIASASCCTSCSSGKSPGRAILPPRLHRFDPVHSSKLARGSRRGSNNQRKSPRAAPPASWSFTPS